MVASVLWTIFCLCFLIKTSQGQGCIRSKSGGGLPNLYDYRNFDDNRITRHHQAIISSYKFDCGDQMCGNITEWGVDVQPGGGGHQWTYTLNFQVWRPSPTVDDFTGTGCYSLVGNNRFTSIPLSGGVAEVTPSPQNYVQFQPGDVLGFYVEEALRDDTDGVVVLTSNEFTTSFTSELVWYASIAPTMTTSQNGDCPYSAGSSGVLNTLIRAAPVISISTVTFSCPPLPTMATTQPTPQPPNPTTDSEETPSTTNQQTQEPRVDPSEGTGTELRVVPTTSETATDLPILRHSESTDIGLIIGSATAGVVVVILTLTVVIIVAVLLKKHGKTKKKEGYSVKNVAAVSTTNQTYGLTHHSKSRVEENIYNYPKVDVDLDTIEAKQNEAYVTHTDIITEGNLVYGTNITTVINSAYGPIKTADEYDYI